MRSLSSVIIMLFLVFPFFVGCNDSDTAIEPETLVSGIDLENMDTSVRPQDDFYSYVNGNWLKKTTIPDDKSSFSAFSEVSDKTELQLENIITEILKKDPSSLGEAEKKIANLYKSYTDTDTLELLGITPIQPTLSAIAAVKNYDDLIDMMGKLATKKVTIPFSYYVGADANDSKVNILYLYQDGLGLPNRDYYLKSDTTFTTIQTKYKTYIKDLFILSQFDGNATAIAENIYNLEYQLAQIQWSNAENRDALKTYNKLSLSDANKLLGNDFDLTRLLENMNIYNANDLVISQPSYCSDFGKLFKRIPLDTWKEYLLFHYMNDYARFLSKAFVDLHFSFYETTINGITEQRSRKKQAIDLINEVIGELFGKIYVEKYFPSTAKRQMQKLVANLLESYDQSIDELTWMQESTKAAAREKLHKITTKIGYPDTFETYDSLDIKDDDLVGNFVRYAQYSIDKDIDMIGKAVDRTKWDMLPQTVNAYYNPTNNEVVFPSAILQPPFFNMDADMAVNYGAIGSVIGHEISHAFDDYGSKYDGDGNLHDWWTPEDAKKFKALGELLVKQYDKYEPLPGHFINGKLTLGENMADLNGVTISYKAYQLSLQGRTPFVLENFTGEERFFIGWAQIWRNKMRKEELLKRLIVDPHSPAKYRVIGVLTNRNSFYDAFNVTAKDLMYTPKEDRITIW